MSKQAKVSRIFTPLSFFIGHRYVKSRHGHGFTSFISASSTLGIALGVMVLIVVLSAMNGFERELANRLLSMVSHVEYTVVDEPIENWQAQITAAEQDPDVIAAAPLIMQAGMAQKGDKIKALQVRGVNLVDELKVSSIGEFVAEHEWKQLANDNTIILGQGVAKQLGVTTGDKIQLLLPKKSSGAQFVAPAKYNLTVVGTFTFGGGIDASQAYVSLNNAAKMLKVEDAITGIRLRVNDVYNAPSIARKVGGKINAYVYVTDWTRTQGHLFNDIQLVRMVMYIVLVLVIAVASFNIVSTLIMAVNERKSDIAILKTMGAENRTVMGAFIVLGLSNGVFGTLIGATSGVLISVYLTDIVTSIETFFGVTVLSGDIYFVDFIPTMLRTGDVIVACCSALFLTVLATLYPAWKATKIEPARVLGGI